jgi:hypothetical protein
MIILVGYVLTSPILASSAFAQGWCSLSAGSYSVVSHGTKSPYVWIYGNFVGQTNDNWIPIKNSSYGESTVAITLAAQLAGKGVSVYLDGENDTCANYENWIGVIRHVRIDN